MIGHVCTIPNLGGNLQDGLKGHSTDFTHEGLMFVCLAWHKDLKHGFALFKGNH